MLDSKSRELGFESPLLLEQFCSLHDVSERERELRNPAFLADDGNVHNCYIIFSSIHVIYYVMSLNCSFLLWQNVKLYFLYGLSMTSMK